MLKSVRWRLQTEDFATWLFDSNDDDDDNGDDDKDTFLLQKESTACSEVEPCVFSKKTVNGE